MRRHPQPDRNAEGDLLQLRSEGKTALICRRLLSELPQELFEVVLDFAENLARLKAGLRESRKAA